MITKEELMKVLWSPGICSLSELQSSKEFMEDLKTKLHIFRESYGTDPLGFTLESKLENLEYYFERFENGLQTLDFTGE